MNRLPRYSHANMLPTITSVRSAVSTGERKWGRRRGPAMKHNFRVRHTTTSYEQENNISILLGSQPAAGGEVVCVCVCIY